MGFVLKFVAANISEHFEDIAIR